jgi:hypothetical protein
MGSNPSKFKGNPNLPVENVFPPKKAARSIELSLVSGVVPGKRPVKPWMRSSTRTNPRRRPDRFFSAEQQRRLEELMARWRASRDAGSTLASQEQQELDQLIDAELRAAGQRAVALATELAG